MIYRQEKTTRLTEINRVSDVTRYTDGGAKRQPDILYLTLGKKAPEEMYISYHLPLNAPILPIYYKKSTDNEWLSETPHRVKFQNENIYIYHTLLSNLDGDTEYEFKIGDFDKVYKFITLPNVLNESVNIAFGSDFHHGYDTFKANLEVMASYDPRVFLFAGDFVDDDGYLDRSDRWITFWDNVAHKLIDSNGRLIPWFSIIGNHEFSPGNQMKKPFFFDMFPNPKPERNYGVLDIGDYMSLYYMDLISLGYTTNGDKAWEYADLEAQRNYFDVEMAKRSNKKYKVAMYHPAFYSSDRTIYHESVRLDMKMLLKDHKIKLGLCGHDHVYKKTHKIKINGLAIDDEIANENDDWFLEIGDGGMADKLYPGDRVGEWYIDTYAIHKPHVNIIKLESDKMTIQAIGTDGQVFDSTVIDAD